jgi:hypothetical protein
MKKSFLVFAVICFVFALFSCGGGKKGAKCIDCPSWGKKVEVKSDKEV